MASRLNGLLGGVLHRESWTLSQSFFFGSINGATPADIHVGDGEECLDEAEELDPGMPYQPGQAGTAPAAKGGKGKPDYASLSELELLELITTGAHYHGPGTELLRRWAQQDVPIDDAKANLAAAFDAVPQAQHDRKWSSGSIPRWAAQVYARMAKKKGTFLRALFAFLEDDAQWCGAIRRNNFTQVIEVCDPVPPQSRQIMDSYRPLRDPEDILETLLEVQGNGFPNAGKGNIADALVVIAARHAYHPVEDWLKSLEWDGRERINKLFISYFPGELPADAGARREKK